MFTKYIMDYKYKYLKYYKKYLNLIDSNFEQTYGGSREFENTKKLFIMYQSVGEQNNKALTERKRILLNIPNLRLQFGHITLLSITFNRDHYLFRLIESYKERLAGYIRNAFDTNLHNVTITHTTSDYDLMGPFWGKNYELDDHSQLRNFRNSIYGYIGTIIRKKLKWIGNKTINDIKYNYWGIEGDTIDNSLYCIPEYHTGENWIGHISVVNLSRNLSFSDTPLNRIFSGESDRNTLNNYIQVPNNLKVNQILNSYISKYMSEHSEDPIYYSGRKERNLQGKIRTRIMPWTDITFKRGRGDLNISFTPPEPWSIKM